jgi:hypothetical protein
MSSQPTSERRVPSTGRPYLRLLRGPHGERPVGAARESREVRREQPQPLDATPQPLDATPQPLDATPQAPSRSRILVAGADPQLRATVLRDLSESLPAETQFGEAGAAWEVLEQAPSSGVVMLAGDLDEVTAESLMHVLGHRYPSLPVVALGLTGDGHPSGGGARVRAAAQL